VPHTEGPLTPGFWRNWPTAKVLLFGAVGMIFFGIASGAGPWATGRLSGLLLYLFVWNWIAHERRRFPDHVAQYNGLAFLLLWPIAVPVYLVQTRGWRRSLVGMLAVSATVVAATLLGAVELFG